MEPLINATSGFEFEGELDPRGRVWIADVQPCVDGGLFDAKRSVGDLVDVSCSLIADGHAVLAGEVRHRIGKDPWEKLPLLAMESGRWQASFLVELLGRHEVQLQAWIDPYATWRAGIAKKAEAGQELSIELLSGAELILQAAERATADERRALREAAMHLGDAALSSSERWAGLSPAIDQLTSRLADRTTSTTSAVYGITVEAALARFGSWYELFPRDAGSAGKHGTFKDVEAQLGDLQAMGFDVLYLPPIHPIGRTLRKGRTNAEPAKPGDPGSPWAVGALEGGHTAVHPELGTLDDFRHLVTAAHEHGIALAIDVAFQASPDHPWVREHPNWFRHRPDGSIQYAENPPKRYEDIYPFDFDTRDWKALWRALRDVFLFWIDQGVKVFRVDNPHTKPLPFWRWCLAEVQRHSPEVIFLAEAFTRPALMYALAKVGFSQSYTYFTWRQTSAELSDYLLELTRPPISDFFRPSFWPNTPDILPEHLQVGGRAAFMARLILAGTLSSNYGIYGPVFELQEHAARPHSEEYASSEKYQLRSFDRSSPDSLRDLVTRLNRIRRAHPALQRNLGVAVHGSDNPQILAFSKRAAADVVLTVVNLDPYAPQRARLSLDLSALCVSAGEPFLAHDELTDQRYLWTGPTQSLALDPGALPAAILHIRSHHRSEKSFDYYA